ncbi:MAG: 50S ribosomal protein L25 [Victivallaceae bacterium]|nr:50S ribosomal protein L25 [Victivallaceae bacterium]
MSKTNYELAVELRNDLGTGAMRRARKAGKIPAVIYSHGVKTASLFVAARDWDVLAQHDFNLVTLVEGEKRTAAVVKEVQNDYLRSQVVHIDFQEVKMNEKITASIPVIAHGDPVGISKGGNFEQAVHEIEVKCLPGDLPEHLEVNVSALEIGAALHVGDLQLPAGVDVLTDHKLVVFHVAKPVKEEPPAETAAASETEAAEEAVTE